MCEKICSKDQNPSPYDQEGGSRDFQLLRVRDPHAPKQKFSIYEYNGGSDLIRFLTNFEAVLENDISTFFSTSSVESQKVAIIITCIMKTPDDRKYSMHIRDHTMTVISQHDFEMYYQEFTHRMNNRMNSYQTHGSGQVLINIPYVQIEQYTFNALRGGQFIETPKNLALKHAIVNVDTGLNNDCLQYAILAGLKYDKVNRGNRRKTSTYQKFLSELDVEGITKPASLKDVKKVEDKNSLCISVYEANSDGDITPLYVSKKNGTQVQLLLLHKADEMGNLFYHFTGKIHCSCFTLLKIHFHC